MFDRYFHLFIIMTYMTGICQKTLCYCDSYECTEWTSNIMELIQIWNIILDQNFWFQWMYNNFLFQGPNARTATIDSNTNKSFNLLYFTVFTNKSKVPEDRRTTNYLNSLSMNVLWTLDLELQHSMIDCALNECSSHCFDPWHPTADVKAILVSNSRSIPALLRFCGKNLFVHVEISYKYEWKVAAFLLKRLKLKA